MRRGRKYNDEIDERIISILKGLKVATPENIRKEYKRCYEEELSWITVKKHLEILTGRNVIKKQTLSKGRRRELNVYSK